MSRNVGPLGAVAFGAALAWGLWTLVPVAIGAGAAFIAIVHYGFSAFSVPAWALGLGAAAAALAAGFGVFLRAEARTRFLKISVFVAKLAVLLFVTVGASAAIVLNLPELQAPAASEQARLVANMESGLSGIWTIFAWLGLVVLPVTMAGVALRQLWDARAGMAVRQH